MSQGSINGDIPTPAPSDRTPQIKFSDRKASVQPRAKPSDILIESLTVPHMGGMGGKRPSGVEIDPSAMSSGKVLPIQNFRQKAGGL